MKDNEVVGHVFDGAVYCLNCGQDGDDPIFAGDAGNDACEECGEYLVEQYDEDGNIREITWSSSDLPPFYSIL